MGQYRIVERARKNGEVDYIVEVHKTFGGWQNANYLWTMYESLESARAYLNNLIAADKRYEERKIVKETVVEYSK